MMTQIDQVSLISTPEMPTRIWEVFRSHPICSGYGLTSYQIGVGWYRMPASGQPINEIDEWLESLGFNHGDRIIIEHC